MTQYGGEVCLMRIVVGDSPGRGRGVFARVPFRTGELIEECPVIAFDRESRALIDRTALYGYYFYWGPGGDLGAIALGFGSLYNHSSMPNASFERYLNSSSIVFRALCPITAGEEITYDYKGDPRFDAPFWFDPA